MKKAYIYPISSRFHGQTHNPYLENFMDCLEDNFMFVNRNYPSKIGVFDIYRYIFNLQYIFFHWPEDMVERKFGFLQAAGFFLLILLCRIKGIKLIYVLHNKLSHTRKRLALKKMIAMTLLKNGKVITHAKEGVLFTRQLSKKNADVLYFPHPVDPGIYEQTEKDTDILIWGNIAPYKGIHKFLEIYNNKYDHKDWKLTIAGRISDKNYLSKLQPLINENIKIINTFLDEAQLSQLICRSKIVLFPYQPDSILSSGAFAKTMAYPVEIIGPDSGAFLDFKYLDYINTYKNLEELPRLLDERLSNFNNAGWQNKKIVSEYSWRNFGIHFYNNKKTQLLKSN